MKTLIVLALVAFVAVHARPEGETDVQKTKVCLQGEGQCGDLRASAKTILLSLRDARTGDLKADFVSFLKHLKEIFTLAAKYECRVDLCRCDGTELQCAQVVDKVRSAMSKLETPECLAQSEKAKELLDNLKAALASEDRQQIATVIGELTEAVEKAFDENDTAKLECLKQSVKNLKTNVKDKIKKYDMQPFCDFCKAPTNPAALAN